MRRALLVLALLVLAAPAARAGRTHFGWLYDVETIPERTAEIQTWLLEENGKGPGKSHETTALWEPVVGITDRLELALPIELSFESEGGAGGTELNRFGAELHWRLTDPDPVEGGPFAPLLRLGVKRPVQERSTVRVEGDLVLGYDLGRLHLVADVGGIMEANPDQNLFEVRPGAGASVRVWKELRLGAEFYSEIGLGDNPATDWYSVGPNASWTHGRFWLSASYPIGVAHIDAAPRFNWGLAF